jgi:transcriptional regulator with XRE-family HTH domain
MNGKRTKRDRFAARLEKAINDSELTQLELARRLGHPNANMITMFKKGTTRLPPEKVAPMALALHIDPGELLRAWFEAYDPAVLPAIEEYLGLLLSSAESSWIRGLRRCLGAVPQYDDGWSGGIKSMVDGKGQ